MKMYFFFRKINPYTHDFHNNMFNNINVYEDVEKLK